MTELYIYYRVADGAATTARREIEAAQAALRMAHPGLDARLLQRLDEARPGEQTWMEIYRAPGGLPPEVAAATLAAVLAAVADLPRQRLSERHVERFAPLG